MSAPPLPDVYVAALSEIDETIPFPVQLSGDVRLCLVRSGDDVYAFEDRCPHRDFPLSGGDVVAPCVIECSWHGARFDLRSGAVVQGPATDPLQLLRVRVEDGAVFVSVLRRDRDE